MAVYFPVETSLDDKIKWLDEYIETQSATFTSPGAILERSRYRANHPTDITVLKCMDGRINLAVACKIPPGIIHALRNLGGRFNIGWPHLGEVVAHHVENVVSEGRRSLVLISYHFSVSQKHWGCAGFGYNKEEAIASMKDIRSQVRMVFGKGSNVVYPVLIGYDTDEDIIILHSGDDNVEPVDVGTLSPDVDILALLNSMYPDMHPQMVNDFAPLIRGNIEHIANLREASPEVKLSRKPDYEHREWILGLGSGFNFLHAPNQALIVGPFSPDLRTPISTAAKILKSNMAENRVSKEGILVLIAVAYTENGHDRLRAELKSKFLAELAEKTITEDHPDLVGKFRIRAAVFSNRDWTLVPTTQNN